MLRLVGKSIVLTYAGVDFERMEMSGTIKGWTAEWHGIRGITNDYA